MISNEKQYRITKTRVKQFKKALAEASMEGAMEDMHPKLQKAHKDALKSQLKKFQDEIEEYEKLRAGESEIIIRSLADLPRALIQSRIALKLSQKALAKLLGINEQQLQRYEANNYEGASIDRIQQILGVMGVDLLKAAVLSSVEKNRE